MKAEGWQRLIPDETTRQWFRYAVMRWALSYFITLLVWAVGIPGMGAAAALIFLLSFSFVFLLLQERLFQSVPAARTGML